MSVLDALENKPEVRVEQRLPHGELKGQCPIVFMENTRAFKGDTKEVLNRLLASKGLQWPDVEAKVSRLPCTSQFRHPASCFPCPSPSNEAAGKGVAPIWPPPFKACTEMIALLLKFWRLARSAENLTSAPAWVGPVRQGSLVEIGRVQLQPMRREPQLLAEENRAKLNHNLLACIGRVPEPRISVAAGETRES